MAEEITAKKYQSILSKKPVLAFFAVLLNLLIALPIIIFAPSNSQEGGREVLRASLSSASLEDVVMADNPIEAEIPETAANGPDNAKPAEIEPVQETKEPEKPKPDSVVISKIGADVPIVVADTYNNSRLHALLDSGAVLYPGSSGFGNDGQSVLLGHSAPANWPNIKHDTAFSRINELAAGDIVTVNFGGKSYEYYVLQNEIIAKGGDLTKPMAKGSSLMLLTCWPPGRDQKRLVVETQLVE